MRNFGFVAAIVILTPTLGCTHNAVTASAPAAATPSSTNADKVSPPASATVAAESAERTMCSRDGDSRMLKIERLQPKGCRFLYPNAGTQTAASSVGVEHCEKVQKNVQGNLEKLGFKCSREGDAPAAQSKPINK